MAGSSRRGGGDEGYMIPGEDSGDPLISVWLPKQYHLDFNNIV